MSNTDILFNVELHANSSKASTENQCLQVVKSLFLQLDGASTLSKKEDDSVKIAFVSPESEENKIKTLMYLQSILFTSHKICLFQSNNSFEINGSINVTYHNKDSKAKSLSKESSAYKIKNGIIKKADGQILFPTLLNRLEDSFTEEYKKTTERKNRLK